MSCELCLTEGELRFFESDEDVEKPPATEPKNPAKADNREIAVLLLNMNSNRPKNLTLEDALRLAEATEIRCHNMSSFIEPTEETALICQYFAYPQSKNTYMAFAVANFGDRSVTIGRIGYNRNALHEYNMAMFPLVSEAAFVNFLSRLGRDRNTLIRGNRECSAYYAKGTKLCADTVKKCHICSAVPCLMAFGTNVLSSFHNTLTCPLCSLFGWLVLYKESLPLNSWTIKTL